MNQLQAARNKTVYMTVIDSLCMCAHVSVLACEQKNTVEERVMRHYDAVQKLQAKLNQVSVFDYRAVLLPIVKAFLQVRDEGGRVEVVGWGEGVLEGQGVTAGS